MARRKRTNTVIAQIRVLNPSKVIDEENGKFYEGIVTEQWQNLSDYRRNTDHIVKD